MSEYADDDSNDLITAGSLDFKQDASADVQLGIQVGLDQSSDIEDFLHMVLARQETQLREIRVLDRKISWLYNHIEEKEKPGVIEQLAAANQEEKDRETARRRHGLAKILAIFKNDQELFHSEGITEDMTEEEYCRKFNITP